MDTQNEFDSGQYPKTNDANVRIENIRKNRKRGYSSNQQK
jgi:hypothetical protein